MRKKLTIILLSFIFSSSLIIGNSFINTNSFLFIKKYVLLNCIYFFEFFIILFIFIKYIFDKLDNGKIKNYKLFNNKLFKLFDSHPFIFSFVFILLCWLIYIIAYYPIILSKDPSFQIKQFFNIPNKYSTYVNLLDKNVLLTNHHPVIHTLILGLCLKFGMLVKSTNIGLFIYSLIQVITLLSTLCYTIVFLKNLKVPKLYRFIILLIYAIVPFFPYYAMSAVKDVFFTCFIILYIIELYKITKSYNLRTVDIIRFILIAIFVILFRNNGIHVILLSMPFLFLLKKDYYKKILFIFIFLIVFDFSYNRIILPHFNITNGSIREMLSIPFQQTARYVSIYDYEISPSEKKSINGILKYKKLKRRYNPDLSDPVKDLFNKNYTKDELEKYFNTWNNQLKKHPVTYIEATINNTYGYICPLKLNWYFYHEYCSIINDDGFNYHYNSLDNIRIILEFYGHLFPFIPIIGLISNIGFNVWMLLFMVFYFIYKKRYSSIIYLLPSLILVLVCFASPANTYFRYALPYIFSMPLMIGVFMR